jgi:hypothetical protein
MLDAAMRMLFVKGKYLETSRSLITSELLEFFVTAVQWCADKLLRS